MLDNSTVSLVVLAVLQGATEFLPVSSSGHLALAQAILGIGQGDLFDDVMLHLGTLGAVVVFYRRDLWELIRNIGAPGEAGAKARRYTGYLLLGSLPAAVVGLLIEDRIEGMFDRVELVLALMARTGAVLYSSRRVERRDEPLSARRALIIGCAQAVAILPGCSRSGWTIVAGLTLGLSPREATRFSFLLSIPAILGAAVLELAEGPQGGSSAGPLAVAMVVAFLVGLACLRWLVRLVRNMALYRFAWYLWAVALVGTLLHRFA